MDKRIGVIEFGTRGIRLLVADASSKGISNVIYSTGGFSELGRNQDAKGNLAQETFELSKKQATEYVQIAQQKGADVVFGFATEAVRVAPNRKKFLEILKPTLEVTILKEEEEALYSFLASVQAFKQELKPQGLLLVIDQGGGSIELSYGNIDKDGIIVVKGRDSFPLGTIRLTKELVDAKNLQVGFSAVKKLIQNELKNHTPFEELKLRKPQLTVGLGSAITKLAEALSEQVLSTKKNIHGYFINVETINSLVVATDNEVKTKKANSIKDIGIDSNRATLIGGVTTFNDVLNFYKCNGVTVSRHGLRYGVLLSRAGLKYRIEDSHT